MSTRAIDYVKKARLAKRRKKITIVAGFTRCVLGLLIPGFSQGMMAKKVPATPIISKNPLPPSD